MKTTNDWLAQAENELLKYTIELQNLNKEKNYLKIVQRCTKIITQFTEFDREDTRPRADFHYNRGSAYLNLAKIEQHATQKIDLLNKAIEDYNYSMQLIPKKAEDYNKEQISYQETVLELAEYIKTAFIDTADKLSKAGKDDAALIAYQKINKQLTFCLHSIITNGLPSEYKKEKEIPWFNDALKKINAYEEEGIGEETECLALESLASFYGLLATLEFNIGIIYKDKNTELKAAKKSFMTAQTFFNNAYILTTDDEYKNNQSDCITELNQLNDLIKSAENKKRSANTLTASSKAVNASHHSSDFFKASPKKRLLQEYQEQTFSNNS